jgi:hypothetical protein
MTQRVAGSGFAKKIAAQIAAPDFPRAQST